MTEVLYRYHPTTFRGLILAVRAFKRQENKAAYTASVLRQIAYFGSHDPNFSFPSYNEYCNDLRGGTKPKDTRSANEIKNDILERLGG